MLLVDHSRCSLESCPELLANVLSHRPCLTPLVVQSLQLLESCNHVVLLVESLGLLTESLLDFQVLLEIVVTQLLVDLEQVVEVLDSLLIGLPHLGSAGRRYFANSLELLLQLLHARELTVDIVGVLRYSLNFLDNAQFLFKISLLDGLLLSIKLGAFLFKLSQQLLEFQLILILGSDKCLLGVALLHKLSLGLGNLFLVDGKECSLDKSYPIFYTFYRIAKQFLQFLNQLRLGESRKINFRKFGRILRFLLLLNWLLRFLLLSGLLRFLLLLGWFLRFLLLLSGLWCHFLRNRLCHRLVYHFLIFNLIVNCYLGIFLGRFVFNCL